MIRLEKINGNNWEEAIDLAVSEDHKKHVAPNLYSIAEVQFHPGYNAYAIYNGDNMVGFAMYGASEEIDEEDSEYVYPYTLFWILRFMIAEGERFKGYGKEAMKLIINDAVKAGHDKVFLSTDPDNEKGIRFYTKLGFTTTGVMQYEEEVFVLNLE